MAFGNGNTLTANSKTTKKSSKKQSSEQLAIFIRQLGRYQVDLMVNVRAAFNNLLLWPLLPVYANRKFRTGVKDRIQMRKEN